MSSKRVRDDKSGSKELPLPGRAVLLRPIETERYAILNKWLPVREFVFADCDQSGCERGSGVLWSQ
jgi:hypothetical protein